ncbi:helix-turn-helix transcriptional regulator [Streptomyces sp. JJ38]|uniref:helix-turn-helix domain-containing protein n=1 Tax=Streptomyces sp. JJ38 TaxID=2738128 RepID=UPI001C55B2F6|nr:helix-turn-helix transcriptional regulator [Streptomyces sp. JJ38]MBW1597362.1 helix-turn-helix domain-containing protein [Streptomyces sp. JJ38]
MPAREAPTVRQRRLGAELRKLRERAGSSATEAGALLGVGQSRVSNMELGRIGVRPERVEAFARVHGCGDVALLHSLKAMADDRTRQWWNEYRGMLPAAPLEPLLPIQP